MEVSHDDVAQNTRYTQPAKIQLQALNDSHLLRRLFRHKSRSETDVLKKKSTFLMTLTFELQLIWE